MAHLINCFECGAEVSSEADPCPKCRAPKGGYRCTVCRKPEKRSALQAYRTDCDPSLFHSECLKKVQEEYYSFQYSCSVCKHAQRPHLKKICPECGHPTPRSIALYRRDEWTIPYHCAQCSLPLIPIAAKKVKKNGSSDGWLHQLCYNYRDPKRFKEPSTNSNSNSNSNCFLATALYGEDSSKVKVLCSFRDEHLTATSFGRAFISLYVRISPPLARAIAKPSLLRTLTRYCIVTPALFIAKLFVKTDNQR